MRVVRARDDATVVAALLTPFGVAAVVIGELVSPADTSVGLAAAFALAFGFFALTLRRDVRRAAPASPTAVEVVPVRRTVPITALIGVMMLFLALAGAGEPGGMLAGGGAANAIHARWLRRFEHDMGCTVVRILWTWRLRLVYTPVKDRAPAHRIPAHAQSEAARRAP